MLELERPLVAIDTNTRLVEHCGRSQLQQD
ncbi:hypothetical protein PI124_g21693, partial [Phytophthora idaei]